MTITKGKFNSECLKNFHTWLFAAAAFSTRQSLALQLGSLCVLFKHFKVLRKYNNVNEVSSKARAEENGLMNIILINIFHMNNVS